MPPLVSRPRSEELFCTTLLASGNGRHTFLYYLATDGLTYRRTDRRAHRKVSLPISFFYHPWHQKINKWDQIIILSSETRPVTFIYSS